MPEYQLSSDEVVLLRDSKVNYGMRSGELMLTNYCLVFLYSKGIINRTREHKAWNLATIKVYNYVAQAKASRLNTSSDRYLITIQFESGEEVFEFLSESKKELGNWIETINELVVGARVGYDPADIGEIQISKIVSDVVGKVRPITEGIASIAQPLIPRISIIKQHIDSESTDELSLDDQIEAVKRLKELLDAGILTEDEFEAKKHDIMGL